MGAVFCVFLVVNVKGNMGQLMIMRKTAITIITILGMLIMTFSMGGCPEEEAGNMSDSEKEQSASNEPNGSVEVAVRPGNDGEAEGAGEPGKYEKATFAAGCFWGVEASFRAVEGVVSTAVGYTGGRQANPTYRQVCTDTTGHAEAVEVVYDPNRVSFEDLLGVFWKVHDPTTLNRQGPDVGTQYRSAVFHHSPEQEALAKASMAKLEKAGVFKRPIVTRIVPAVEFYKAEEYHQRYLEKQGKTSCSSTVH